MNTASIEEMIKFYNLETFIQDDRTQKSKVFTDDELDSLELIKIIDDIDQVDILREIFLKMSKGEKVIDPISFRSIKQKVILQYSKELVKSLSTTEELEEKASSGVEGISIKNEDGIDIINLSGTEFRFFIHTTTMRSGLNNANLDIPEDLSLDEMWKIYENGTSTISGCIIEPDMMASCQYGEEINFGFFSIKPEQILGMGHTDIHATHSKNKINPSFDYGKVSFNYPDELVRKTAAQIVGFEENDETHPYNEVAMLRREINIDDIKKGTFGGRIMPDYIVVYGNATQKHKEIAKRFIKDGKPIPIIEIDTKAYSNNLKSRAVKREDHIIHREESEKIARIKDILR